MLTDSALALALDDADTTSALFRVQPQNRVKALFAAGAIGVRGNLLEIPDGLWENPPRLRQTASASPYAYVNDDPLNATDSTGRDYCTYYGQEGCLTPPDLGLCQGSDWGGGGGAEAGGGEGSCMGALQQVVQNVGECTTVNDCWQAIDTYEQELSFFSSGADNCPFASDAAGYLNSAIPLVNLKGQQVNKAEGVNSQTVSDDEGDVGITADGGAATFAVVCAVATAGACAGPLLVAGAALAIVGFTSGLASKL